MEDPHMQEIIDGLASIGDKAAEIGDGTAAILAAGASGLVAVLCQLNCTLEEIRDEIRHK